MAPPFNSPTRVSQGTRSSPPNKNGTLEALVFELVEMGGIEPPSEREDRNASTRVVELGGSSGDIEDRQKYPKTILEGSDVRSGDEHPILQK